MPAKGVFPLKENCNPDDPEEAFLWMFAALPGSNGGQFIMPIEYFREVSKRMRQLGAMVECPNCGHHEEPELEYIPPSASEPNWATSAGKWVPVGEVSEDDKTRRMMESAIARMGHPQKVDFFKALTAWEARTDLPDTPGGKAVANMIDNEPHLLQVALDVLRELHDAA